MQISSFLIPASHVQYLELNLTRLETFNLFASMQKEPTSIKYKLREEVSLAITYQQRKLFRDFDCDRVRKIGEQIWERRIAETRDPKMFPNSAS